MPGLGYSSHRSLSRLCCCCCLLAIEAIPARRERPNSPKGRFPPRLLQRQHLQRRHTKKRWKKHGQFFCGAYALRSHSALLVGPTDGGGVVIVTRTDVCVTADASLPSRDRLPPFQASYNSTGSINGETRDPNAES